MSAHTAKIIDLATHRARRGESPAPSPVPLAPPVAPFFWVPVMYAPMMWTPAGWVAPHPGG